VWGIITAVASDWQATVAIDPSSAPMLYPLDVFPILAWRMGAYAPYNIVTGYGYPSAGGFFEGRFWFGGTEPNRFDTSQVQGWKKLSPIVHMGPTITRGDLLTGYISDGTVTDACGITYTLESKDKNDIFWFEPDPKGLIAGTLGGEWLIQASNLADPITPMSIQANRVSKYGCANIEPRRTGISLVFVQKFTRRIMEFLSEIWTGKFVAPHLNEAAKHLTTTGIQEIAYQEELAPIIWVRNGPPS
jgi:hypothetical protein